MARQQGTCMIVGKQHSKGYRHGAACVWCNRTPYGDAQRAREQWHPLEDSEGRFAAHVERMQREYLRQAESAARELLLEGAELVRYEHASPPTIYLIDAKDWVRAIIRASYEKSTQRVCIQTETYRLGELVFSAP